VDFAKVLSFNPLDAGINRRKSKVVPARPSPSGSSR